MKEWKIDYLDMEMPENALCIAMAVDLSELSLAAI